MFHNCLHMMINFLKYFKLAVDNCWHSRIAANQMIKNFSIFNIFLLKNETKQIINKMVLDSLIDDHLEVRLCGCLTLTSFIQNNFIDIDQEFIVKKL